MIKGTIDKRQNNLRVGRTSASMVCAITTSPRRGDPPRTGQRKYRSNPTGIKQESPRLLTTDSSVRPATLSHPKRARNDRHPDRRFSACYGKRREAIRAGAESICMEARAAGRDTLNEGEAQRLRHASADMRALLLSLA
jgi:hypothetical protein